ncbi:AAA family ATPase [soil metagenome]
MSDLRILLLGSPLVELDGTGVEMDTRKATALLAYLAVTGERHTRDALAGLLWPEHGLSRARAALRRTLSTVGVLRRDGWLEVDRTGVNLAADDAWIDVERFHAALAECRMHDHSDNEVCPRCIPALEKAAALYRDDFMAGFGLRDSAEFDDWQYFQGERLRRELGGALERLTRGFSARRDWEPAIDHASRWLGLDPLHEPAHRSLIHLYALSGRRAEALRQYRECVRLLDKELGVSPLEETHKLYREVKENVTPPPAPFVRGRAHETSSNKPPASSSGVESPLVGRSAEWKALLRAYEDARYGERAAVLEGEAGIGKTRLAEEFLMHASELGSVTITARCYAGETNLAYGPFVEGLSAALESGRHTTTLERIPATCLAETSRLLPQLVERFPDLPPILPLETPGARTRFFEGIGEVLSAICDGPTPGILFLDDLHWADGATMDLLAYLVRRLARSTRSVLFLLTWRSEEVPRGHRLRSLLAEARREGPPTTLVLRRLQPSAVQDLVGPLTDGSESLAQRLYEETEGLPLFLEEYLKTIRTHGPNEDSSDWSLPTSVRELLLARLHVVTETGWQLLNAAAVMGRSFDFDTLREASGRSEEETIGALEELMQHGLIRELGELDGDLTYDFSHEKLRELVYAETSLARRRLLHRRSAESLAKKRSPDGGSRAGQIARHYSLGGREDEAANYYKQAGKHARYLYANAEALSHFQTALALGHPDTVGLHESIGDVHTTLGDYGAAVTSYESAAALADGPGLSGAEHKLGLLHQRRGEWNLAESHYEAAMEALGETGPSAQLARLYADRSLAAYHQGRAGAAEDLAHRALELAESSGDAEALSQAHNALGILAGSKEDLETARHHLEESLRLAETSGDPGTRAAALNNLARACDAGGEIERAIEHTKTALQLCASIGDRHHEAALHNNLADLLHAAGHSEKAMEHLKQAVAIFAEVGEEGELQPGIWKLTEW